MSKRIVLIGGGGFIGHNLALELNRLGNDVTIIDFLSINNFTTLLADSSRIFALYRKMLLERFDMLQWVKVPIFPVDARDYHQLSLAVAKIKPDVIIHLAAVAHIDRSNKDPYSTFDHSYRTLENALDVARALETPHFIFFSSSTAYGNFSAPVLDETAHCSPFGIYGTLKLNGENSVISHNQVFDLPYTIIRPCALYGPRCISGRVIQKFIEAGLAGEDINIQGDGKDREDFTYIADLIDGVVRIIDQPENSIGEIFNITAGEARGIGELAFHVKQHFPETTITYSDRDNMKPMRGTLSVEKAKRMLGYSPKYTLEKGLEEYIDWYRGFWPKEMGGKWTERNKVA
ncbi:MAG: NAD(P)-dependent oxidoreductase [Proteobacteria bacterium]|nr:NAD(P)-dependent oxidoreductase [Pseudomonadota bacterium]